MLNLKQDAERQALRHQRENEIGDLEPVKNPRRRAKCKKSLYDFILTYCSGAGGFFKIAPSKRMRQIIANLQEVVRDGGRVHLKIARAHGKSSLVKAAVVYAIAYGFRHFIVSVSARKSDASSMIDDIYNLFEDCDEFAEDFPEISEPIRRLGGIMQRAANQTHLGKRTKISKSSEKIIMPTIDDSVSSASIIVARGFKGAARGLVRGSRRPDLVIFDDLQDDKVARNEKTVAQYDETIEKSFMGLGGHDKQISALMTSTPIMPNDLSELYSKKKNWITHEYPMMLAFPTCYKAASGDLWKEYFAIRQDSVSAGKPEHIASNAFYKFHRGEMDAGGEVLNPLFYDRATELSGIQHAMNLIFSNGENAFAAEYQMRPVSTSQLYDLNAQVVLSRVRKDTPMLALPPGTVFVSVATDLNPAYGFSSVMTAFDRNQTGMVVWYDLHPTQIAGNIPTAEVAGRVYAELALVGRGMRQILSGMKGVNFLWGVDAGYDTNVVRRFVANSKSVCGVPAYAMFGKSAKFFNPNVRSRIQLARSGTVLCSDGQCTWLNWNADQWRETSQRAWLGEIGAPGSLSLFDGGMRHGEFAAQVTAERLTEKVTVGDKDIFTWSNSTKKHDFGDGVAMCFALAANFGITENACLTATRKRKKRTSNRFMALTL